MRRRSSPSPLSPAAQRGQPDRHQRLSLGRQHTPAPGVSVNRAREGEGGACTERLLCLVMLKDQHSREERDEERERGSTGPNV